MYRNVPFAYGLRDSKLEKSSLNMVPVRIVQLRSGTSKLSFFVKKELTEENQHISIRELCEKCDVSTGTAVRIVRDDLDLTKIVARDRDTPSPNRPVKETGS